MASHFSQLAAISKIILVCANVLRLGELVLVVRFEEQVGRCLVFEVLLVTVLHIHVSKEREDATTRLAPPVAALELHRLIEKLGLPSLVTRLGSAACTGPYHLMDGAGVAPPRMI